VTNTARWDLVKRVFQAALERMPHEREVFLRETCGEDSALRAEVESLLVAHEQAGSFAERPAFALLTQSARGAISRVLDREGDFLKNGDHLGPYHITQLLGAGGMGEVYRACDTKLGREVAIKILPPAFTTNPDRLARFEREARVLATLNHPHIAAIYCVEETDGLRGLVLELVHGETLADRLRRGPIPVAEALAIARQIVDALDAAHEKGIVHRDLKPRNVKINPEGLVKVLDFGLARIESSRAGEGQLFDSPTETIGGTKDGAILGTEPYMSPEQARGQAVDKRTDIWAFGCVLYEMLTGHVAFKGQTVSDTIAAVLKNEPQWEALPDETPFMIRRLLRQCLEKDPRKRLRDIGDTDLAGETESEAIIAPAPRLSVRWKLAVAGLTVITAIAMAGWWRATRPALQPSMRLALDLAQGVAPALSTSPAVLSPDGTRIVHLGRSASRVQLFVRAIDAHDSTPLPGTDNAIQPFFSPDGQSVGFFAGGRLKKIALQGGSPVDLCDAPNPRGASWGEDGNIIAELDFGKPLVRIAAAGGSPQEATELRQAATHRYPQVLPGAQAVVFTASNFIGDFDQATVEIQSLRTGERKTLVRGYYGRYAASGHLLYVRNATVYARQLDVDRQELVGPEVPVITNVKSRASNGYAFFDVSLNGTLIYAEGEQAAQRLTWLNSTGHSEPLRARAAQYSQFPLRFSPDGTRLALGSIDRTNRDVWVYELQRDAWTRLTTSLDIDDFPVWSPDGIHIAYISGMGSSGTGVFWKRADGTGEAVRLFASENVNHTFSFSPDGKYLAYSEGDPHTKTDLWLLSIDNARIDDPKVTGRTSFLRTEFNEDAPAISPDGRWLAYQSDESGRNEVYVRPFQASVGKWAVSTKGGSSPVWSKKAPELFFATSEGIEKVTYRANGTAFEPGTPRLSVARNGLSPVFDLSPVSNRFVIVESVSDDNPSARFTYVLNFVDELRRRAPIFKR
jgi:serine/threonine-protein kinase